jgi:hypothetical protein
MSDPIEVHLQRLDSIVVSPESGSANLELAQLMTAVQEMNADLGISGDSEEDDVVAAFPIFGKTKTLRAPDIDFDALIKRISDWISKLADKLTAIVEKLANGTSFSISVGTGISVTVNFPPVGNHG